MAARKRPSATNSTTTTDASKPEPTTTPEPLPPKTDDPPIAPPKSGLILKLFLILSLPYFYLIFYHYQIESELRRSILINAGLSLAGFFVTQRMIPVASRYVLRRNLFGFDINKKGTPQGTVKVWVFLKKKIMFELVFLGDLFQWTCVEF